MDYAFGLLRLATSSSEDFVVLNADDAVPATGSSLAILGSGFGSQLQEAQVLSISDQDCESSKNPAGFPVSVGESQFCAGDSQRGFCVDDWGGPLIIKGSNDTATPESDIQVGVAAWYDVCAQDFMHFKTNFHSHLR